VKAATILFVVAILTAFSAQAEVSFFARIDASAEAENSALARETAMEKAQRDAFLEVAARLTGQANLDELNKLTDEQLQNFIREVSVVSETSTTNSYRADLNIEINGALLKRYLQENDMLEITEAPEEILIIPLYAETGNASKMLWEDQNLWRQAWLDKGNIKAGNISFKVIADIQSNRQRLSADRAFTMDTELYTQLAQDAKINRIAVVTAVQAGRNTIVLIIKSFPDGKETRLPVFSDTAAVTDAGVAQTVAFLTKEAQNANDTALNRNKIQISYTFPNLKIWLDTERRLKRVPQIKMLETGSAENGRITFTLEYGGDYPNLLDALEKENLELSVNNGIYTLTRTDQ
jgi:hypothetical protein